jgi:hypothetical protein
MAVYRGRSSSTLDATPMRDVVLALFEVSAIYIAGSVLAVFTTLRRRGVPVSYVFAGFPGYLYRRAVEAGVEVALRRFALSTTLAYVFALILAVILVVIDPT